MKERADLAGPLAGVRVLEFGQIAAGPFTGSLLADLGADVVKVENPAGGDGMRSWPPLTPDANGELFSENFASINRNKRSIAVDLKNPESLKSLKELIGVCDIVVENFRAGVLRRLGLGFDELVKRNPRLVYCSISGYGQTGPYAKKGAFDVTVQAMSGLMSATGEDGRPPVKCGVPVGDFGAGLYAAYAILAALLKARETGQGSYIDCSMLGSLIGMSALQTSEFFGTGKGGGRLGSAHPRNAPYQAFRASDDYFVIAAGNDTLWGEVAQAVGLPELTNDPRFLRQADRASNQLELEKILNERFASKTADEWLLEMDRRGVPCSPINTYADILADPQVAEMRLVRDLALPNGVITKTTAFPVAMSNYEFAVRLAPPQLGEHSNEVVDDWLGDQTAKQTGAANKSS